MPPSSLSESLGIGGGQSLGDFLSLSDTPTIRKKYYDTIDSGLGAASETPQLDQGALLWQGIIPALAAAILTKGKSFGVSGGPLSNVLTQETARAKESQKLSIESKLKGAGLLGDTLDKRDTLAAAAVGRQDTLRQSREIADQNLQERQLTRQTASEDRRAIADQSDATKKEVAGMIAGSKQDAADTRNTKAGFAEENTVLDDYEKEAKPLREKATQLSQIIKLADLAKSNPEASKAAQGMIAGLGVQISQGGGRVSDKDIQLVGGGISAQGELNKLQNWIDGGARGEMPKLGPEALAAAARVLGKAYASQYVDVDKKYRTRTSMMGFGDQEKTNKYLDQASPDFGVGGVEKSSYTLPSGKSVTAGELKSQGYDIPTLIKEGKLK